MDITNEKLPEQDRTDLYRKMDLVSKAVVDMMMDVQDFYAHLERIHDQRLELELKRKFPIDSELFAKLPLIVSEYFRISPKIETFEKKTWIHRMTIDDMRRESLNPQDKKPNRTVLFKGQITLC